jgi:hypothetical protein
MLTHLHGVVGACARKSIVTNVVTGFMVGCNSAWMVDWVHFSADVLIFVDELA